QRKTAVSWAPICVCSEMCISDSSHPPRHASQTQPPATPRIAKSPYTALLSMGLTQYSGGPGPALFGSGYNSTGRWWGVSFLCSIPSLLIWFVVGGAWFKVIGWW
ncbi:anion permease, partial [Propionibacterium freudenreichii]|nr:anion permease [Propionibacterium freudenreichii]